MDSIKRVRIAPEADADWQDGIEAFIRSDRVVPVEATKPL